MLALAAAVSVGLGAMSIADQPKGELRGSKGTVYLFLSTDCPVAMQYTPRINALVKEYADEGFKFQALFPNDMESKPQIETYMRERSYSFPYDVDLGASKAKGLGVSSVPSVVVLDGKGQRVYLGAIDDNQDSRLVKKSYLANVLKKLDSGESVKFEKTNALGCVLMPSKPVPAADKINYAEFIAPIINKHCVECHRPGEVAPFSLIGYDNTKKWAPMIAQVAGQRKMPPWKAVHGYGEFLDENRLTETEIATLKLWSENDAPRGDAKKEPATPTFSSSWALGEPNLQLSQTKPYEVDGNGADEYRNFVMPLNNRETMWVTGMDVRPGNTKIVHHVIAFIDSTGQGAKQIARNKDGKEGYPGGGGGVGFLPYGSLGGWAPGLRPRHTPDKTAFEVPPNSSIVLQIHYHKDGKIEHDQTHIGLYVAKEKPRQPIRLRWLANPLFMIPPGAKDHKVKLEYKIPANVTLYGAMPHMHLLGRSMKATVILPDGTKKPLIFIDDWDFNWQMTYALKEPMKVPAGSTLLVEGTYDNSADNPNNPNNPPKTITWGEQTTDEMFLLIVPYTIDGEILK